MKKILIILCFLLILPSYACRAVTNEEYNTFLKKIGLNKEQISQLRQIKSQKNSKINTALEESRNCTKTNNEISHNDKDKHVTKLLEKIQKEYEADLLKIMNKKQQEQILYNDSLVF